MCGFGRIVTVTLLASGSLVSTAAGETLGLGEEMALARLEEIRAVGKAYRERLWPGFDPSEVPAILFEPGGWAMAVGFSEPPEGFRLAEGLRDGQRPVYRAGAGKFTHEGRSPARVGGRWAVLMEIEGPDPMPVGLHMGRRSAEEAIADFIGDAFLLFLMDRRGADTPFVSEIVSYPDSAELMALTAVEHRALLQSARMLEVDETNIDQFLETARQIVAVRRARWNLMGPEVAAHERAIESWESLRCYTVFSLHRLSAWGGITPAGIAAREPTYLGYKNGPMFRTLMTNYPLTRSPDNPTATAAEVAARGCTMAFLLDRIDFRYGWKERPGGWRSFALPGDEPLVETLAGGGGARPEEDGPYLEAAKERHQYDPALRLARADLERLRKEREDLFNRLFPPGDRLEIHLGGVKAEWYEDDSATTGHLGMGRLVHGGRLALRTSGVDLSTEGAEAKGMPRVLTRAGASRGTLESIIVRLGEGSTLAVGGRSHVPAGERFDLSPHRPLLLNAAGLRLEVSEGTLGPGPEGSLHVESR